MCGLMNKTKASYCDCTAMCGLMNKTKASYQLGSLGEHCKLHYASCIMHNNDWTPLGSGLKVRTVMLAEKFTHFKQQSWPHPQIVLHFRMSQVNVSMLQPQRLLHLASATITACSWRCDIINPIQQQHASLRVHRAMQRHQSADRQISHQISSLMYAKNQQRQVIMNVLHPGCVRPPRWSPPVLWRRFKDDQCWRKHRQRKI